MDTSALPSELLAVPQPLLGFYGLDVEKNTLHKCIWDTFNNNKRIDKITAKMKILPERYEFPVAKPKRPSYEWYHPKGILKRNWMLKHLHVLPAVVVLFQDLDWNDPHWPEKQIQCASTIQTLRSNLQGRVTRLALVLIQKHSLAQQAEDVFAAERAASLTNACEISAKVLFILPQGDHLMGYVTRLESAFIEMAQSYYVQLYKNIRTHRDQLNGTHLSLKIRHQFKLGFISEMRFDFIISLKHYCQAYSNLDEIQSQDLNNLEVKTIAGFLNYKICKLMFKINTPRDSINHFMNHIDKYKTRAGFQELLFEHYAWLSIQHSAFADLFSEAIKSGLPALQTQHPGIYFHKAAEYACKRRDALQQCYSLRPTEPLSFNSANLTPLFSEFFGIRSIVAGESLTKQQIILIAQENERNFNHSAAIITLLGRAMAQFKIYNCLRFRKKLAIDMAEEYFKNGDYAKSLTLYSLMLQDYRQDNWNAIFTSVLLKTLHCAFFVGSITDFILCSLEALSPLIQIERKDRVLMLENLWKVFQDIPPVPQTHFTPELLSIWENSLKAFTTPLEIDLDKLSKIIESISCFQNDEVEYNKQISIVLFLKSISKIPLKIKNIQIVISNGVENHKLKPVGLRTFNSLQSLKEYKHFMETTNNILFDSDFKIDPNMFYAILFDINSNNFAEDRELKVLHAEYEMGTEQKYILLKKSTSFSEENFLNYFGCSDLRNCIKSNPLCYIVPTFHLSIQNKFFVETMVINEYFKVSSFVTNSFYKEAHKVSVTISVPENLKLKVFLTTDLTLIKQKLVPEIHIDIGTLQPLTCFEISYYILSLTEENIDLRQIIQYTIQSDLADTQSQPRKLNNALNKNQLFQQDFHRKNSLNNCITYIDNNYVKKMKEHTLTISCFREFKFEWKFHSLDCQPMTKAYKGEYFLLKVNIEVLPKFDIDIIDMYFLCDHNLTQSSYNTKQKPNSITYTNGDKLEYTILLRANNTTTEWGFQNFHTKISSNDNCQSSENIFSNLNCNFDRNTLSNKTDLEICNNGRFSDEIQSNYTSKIIFNKTKDAFQATGNRSGFFQATPLVYDNTHINSICGIYSIIWKRSGSRIECESKFLIEGIVVEQPIINIYCKIEEKMFVKIPLNLKITIKNTGNKILNLTAILSNSDNFRYSGHKQLTISIFKQSEKDILFNLYPLKAGWQILPEFKLELENPDQTEQINLNELVQRSMPKKVFILPQKKMYLDVYK